jgi:hypothetical protein
MSATVAKTFLQHVLTLAGSMTFASDGMQRSLLKDDDPRVLAELARVVAARRKDLDNVGCHCRPGANGQSAVPSGSHMHSNCSGLICRPYLVKWTKTCWCNGALGPWLHLVARGRPVSKKHLSASNQRVETSVAQFSLRHSAVTALAADCLYMVWHEPSGVKAHGLCRFNGHRPLVACHRRLARLPPVVFRRTGGGYGVHEVRPALIA